MPDYTIKADTPREAVTQVVELIRHRARNERGIVSLLEGDGDPVAAEERRRSTHAADVLDKLARDVENAFIVRKT